MNNDLPKTKVDISFYIYQSDNYFAQQAYPLALVAAQKANAIAPDCPSILLRIGRIYAKQERYQQALPYLEYVNRWNTHAEARDLLSQCYSQLQRPNVAKAADYLNQIDSVLTDMEHTLAAYSAGLTDAILAMDEQNSEVAMLHNQRALLYFKLALNSNHVGIPSENYDHPIAKFYWPEYETRH